jgi:hypothetical protein
MYLAIKKSIWLYGKCSPAAKFAAATQAQRGHCRFVSGPRARHHFHHLDTQQPQGEIGFLFDIRRLNVGTTRARRKLLLVGDSSKLCSHPFIVEVLAYVKRMGGYRTAHEIGKQTRIGDGQRSEETGRRP